MNICLIGDRGPACMAVYNALVAARHNVGIRRIDRLTPMVHAFETQPECTIYVASTVRFSELRETGWSDIPTIAAYISSACEQDAYVKAAQVRVQLSVVGKGRVDASAVVRALDERAEARSVAVDEAVEAVLQTRPVQRVGVPAPSQGHARVALRWTLLEADAWMNCVRPCKVSVLSGTYNRLSMLQDFITSVRANLHGRVPYEIVLADGGSTDGTLEWAAAQADCRVVHAGLTGAIDAFNLAYEASVGEYVFYANDDTVVVDDGLWAAVEYGEKNPAVPGVAFEFRLPKHKHFECPRLSAEYPHPNVALIRRSVIEDCISYELGALWGDAEHRVHKTYWGDTYLGVVLAKLRYKLHVSPACRVVDRQPADELRQHNKMPAPEWRKRGAHFDQMSGRAEGVGPRVEVTPWQDALVPRVGRLPERLPLAACPPERILVVAAGRSGGPMTNAANILSAIGDAALTVFIDGPASLMAAVRQFKPTLIWMQVQQHVHGSPEVIAAIRAAAPGVFVCSWNGDLTMPDGGYAAWQDRFCASVDLALVSNCDHPARMMLQGCPAAGYLPIGFDSPHVPVEATAPVVEEGPFMFTGTAYSARVDLFGELHQRLQRAAHAELRDLTDVEAVPGVARRMKVQLYGNGWPNVFRAAGAISMSDVGELYHSALGVVSTSITTKLRRYTSDRMKRILGCGGVALIEAFNDYEGFGLRHGTNCLVWRDVDELAALILEWGRPEKAAAREQLRLAGYQLATTTMRWSDTAEHLMALVQRVRHQRRV